MPTAHPPGRSSRCRAWGSRSMPAPGAQSGPGSTWAGPTGAKPRPPLPPPSPEPRLPDSLPDLVPQPLLRTALGTPARFLLPDLGRLAGVGAGSPGLLQRALHPGHGLHSPQSARSCSGVTTGPAHSQGLPRTVPTCQLAGAWRPGCQRLSDLEGPSGAGCTEGQGWSLAAATATACLPREPGASPCGPALCPWTLRLLDFISWLLCEALGPSHHRPPAPGGQSRPEAQASRAWGLPRCRKGCLELQDGHTPARGLPTAPLGAFLESRKLRRTQAEVPGAGGSTFSHGRTPGPALGSARKARTGCPRAEGRGASPGAGPPSPLRACPLLCAPAATLPSGPEQ